MTKRKLTCISDPGHGWLSVSQKDLKTLGIVDKISGFSYMNHTRAFLEEDCDAAIFIDAAKNAGWDIELKSSSNTSTYNNHSSIRSLSPYKAGFVLDPIQVGRVVYDHTEAEYEVTEDKGKRGFILNGLYRVNRSNPYKNLFTS